MAMASLDLTGRRALVLGGGGPLGRVAALALAEAGADVAVATVTAGAEEALDARRTSRRVAALGRRTLVQSLDATNATAVQVMVRQVAKGLGGLEILVNAPDLFLAKPTSRTSDAEWLKLLHLNLSSLFYACRGALREMEKARWGRIVNVTSAVAQKGLPNAAAYGAVKAAVGGLTRALALEYGPRGIRVNAIAPAWLEEGPAGVPTWGVPAASEEALARFIPMRRLGKVEEVGPLIVLLASEGASYINGQTLVVDGGLLARM